EGGLGQFFSTSGSRVRETTAGRPLAATASAPSAAARINTSPASAGSRLCLRFKCVWRNSVQLACRGQRFASAMSKQLVYRIAQLGQVAHLVDRVAQRRVQQ